jgi:hypothetical protein
MSELDDQNEDVRSGKGRKSGGASVSIRDSRMSALVGIGLAITPIAVVGIGAWIANSIGNLNNTVTRLVVQNEAIIRRQDQNDAHDDRQDARMDAADERTNQNSRDIAALGGPNYRGPRGH